MRGRHRHYSGAVESRLIYCLSSLLSAALLALASALPAHAEALPAALALQVTQWARTASDAAGEGKRVEVEVGRLDPRLRLAPCEKIDPYLPSGSRPWGRTRVGLRCVDGPTPWNVYLPVTVRLWAPAPVLREPRPAGYVLTDADFVLREADWAAEARPPITQAAQLVGRTLAQAQAAGAALRIDDLRQRQWFAAGDTVRVIARGRGYSVSSEGMALTRGLEGQSARIRTSTGKVVTGVAVATNRVEIGL